MSRFTTIDQFNMIQALIRDMSVGQLEAVSVVLESKSELQLFADMIETERKDRGVKTDTYNNEPGERFDSQLYLKVKEAREKEQR